jgi:hypothetical protein
MKPCWSRPRLFPTALVSFLMSNSLVMFIHILLYPCPYQSALGAGQHTSLEGRLARACESGSIYLFY